MVDWLSNATRSMRTFWHRMVGRVCFRFRRREAARRHFEQVLLLKGDDFVAYFYLARVAYAAGDNTGYQQRLAMAKRTSPERMARIRYLFDYFEPNSDKDGLFEENGERATWRAFRMSSVGGDEQRVRGERGLSSCPGGDLRQFGDDFSSKTERDRFADLPPILPEDIRRVDWDRLSDAL